MKTHLLCLLSIAFALGIIGCSESNPVEEVHSDFESIEHACEHMSGTAGTAVTATEEGNGPDISAPHTRFDVTLPGTPASRGGSAFFTADESAEFLVMLNKDIPLVLSQGGAAITPEETFSAQEILDSAGCSSIVKVVAIDLDSGTAVISFGPTVDSLVSVVIEETGHHHDH